MKRLSIVFLMVMFLANTLVVSAWAKPCMMNETAKNEVVSSLKNADLPPCHEQNNTDQGNDFQNADMQHCEGLCLCLHVAIAQTPVLTDYYSVPGIDLGTHIYTFINEHSASRAYAPSNPPPIFIS